MSKSGKVEKRVSVSSDRSGLNCFEPAKKTMSYGTSVNSPISLKNQKGTSTQEDSDAVKSNGTLRNVRNTPFTASPDERQQLGRKQQFIQVDAISLLNTGLSPYPTAVSVPTCPSYFPLPPGSDMNTHQWNRTPSFVNLKLNERLSSSHTSDEGTSAVHPGCVFQSLRDVSLTPKRRRLSTSNIYTDDLTCTVNQTGTSFGYCRSANPKTVSVTSNKNRANSSWSEAPISEQISRQRESGRTRDHYADTEASAQEKLDRKRAQNRIAAKKCYNKKLEKIVTSETMVTHLEGVIQINDRRLSEIGGEVEAIKSVILAHIHAGCISEDKLKDVNVPKLALLPVFPENTPKTRMLQRT